MSNSSQSAYNDCPVLLGEKKWVLLLQACGSSAPLCPLLHPPGQGLTAA